MEHVYTVQTKIIHDKTYYFVKKILALPEFPGLAEVVVGYGMHTDFEKACNIAGIKDIASRQKLLLDLEKITGIYFKKDERPVVERNRDMVEEFKKMQTKSKLD